jgi:disulfide bond formation protein DsbB
MSVNVRYFMVFIIAVLVLVFIGVSKTDFPLYLMGNLAGSWIGIYFLRYLWAFQKNTDIHSTQDVCCSRIS